MYKSRIILTTILTGLIIVCNSQLDMTSKENVARDIQVSLSAKVYDCNVYFNITMLNESIEGYYSLVKILADGSFESIGVKKIAVNTINQPIQYSFKDKSGLNTDESYQLIRICKEPTIIATWVCNDSENSEEMYKVILESNPNILVSK